MPNIDLVKGIATKKLPHLGKQSLRRDNTASSLKLVHSFFAVDRSRILVRQEGHDEARAPRRLPLDGHESARKWTKRDLDQVKKTKHFTYLKAWPF